MTEFRFEWDKVEDVAKGKELGRRFFKDRVVCRFLKQGGDIVLTVFQDGKLVPSFEQAHFRPRSMDKMDIENAETMRRVYDEFMRAGEQNDEGFPIREWSAVTRAEAENLLGLGFTTLEKLATAPDDVLRTFTGGKELKQKAQGWLDDAKDKGIMASKYERLQKALEAKEDEVVTLKKQIGALVEQVEALTKASLKSKEK
jgi:hypothetical protein